jgi:CRP-like cAMP-binding protein
MSISVLAGSLKFLNLGEIIQLLGSNSSTGVLRIKSKYAQKPGLIYIVNGNPVDASAGSVTGLDAVNALFGWLDGEFEFSEESVEKKNVIKKSRMEIMLDGLSLLDDGHIEILGPVTYDKKSKDPSKESTLPIIRGPLVDYMYVVDEEEVYDGSQITVEGKHGSWFCVILEGTADIYKETPEGLLTVLRIGEGAFVGSIASFLVSGSVRSATIKAVGNVQLGVLDSQRLGIDYSKMSPDLKTFVLSLDNRLKQVSGLAADIQSNKVAIEEFVKGKKPVMKQDESNEKLFMITEGEACIVRKTERGYVPLATLGKKDFYGNIPFLDMGQEPFSAMVLGSEDLEVKEMDPEILQNEHSQLSATFKNIIEHLATCISVTTIIASDFHKKIAEKKANKS